MNSKNIIFIFTLLVLFSISVYCNGAWHPEKNYWPRTIIDSSQSEIDAVRNKVLSSPFSSIYTEITNTSEIDYSSVSTQKQKARIARCAAFRYLVDEEITYGDKAKEYLMVTERQDYSSAEEHYKNILWDSEILSLDCITYDFLKGMEYDFEGDEAQVRSQIKNIASTLYEDLVIEDPWNLLYLMWVNGLGEQINYGVKFASAMGMAAIVLNTETGSVDYEQPETWIGYSMATLNKQFVEEPTKGGWLVGDNGSWAEGPHYMSFSASNFIPFAIAHYNFVDGESEEYNGINLAPLLMWENFAKNAEWGVNIRQPNGARPDFDDSFLDPFYFNGALASFLDNTDLAWDYENSSVPFYSQNTSGNMDVEMICLVDPAYFGSPEPDAPFSKFLPTAGQTIFRSDWGDEAVYCCLMGENNRARIGGHTHEHPDNTSFIIHAYGELLAMDSGYISWDERDKVRYAENHSLILVDGEGPPAADAIYANGTDAFLQYYFDTGSYDYSEVTTNYQDTDFTRCVSFVDNTFFVITDFVDGNSSHNYDWLLHGNGGGDTGNGFELQSHGSKYSVNGIDLNLFLESSSTLNLSNDIDYHDSGTYNVPATHEVTKGSVTSEDAVFSAFLYPAPNTKSVTFTPSSSSDFTGGTMAGDGNKTFYASKNNSSVVNTSFSGYDLNFDSEILLFSTKVDSYIPKSVFCRNGQSVKYDNVDLISTTETTNLNLNIFDDHADGFIQNGCEVSFYTGNHPSSLNGADSWEFDSGFTTAQFSDSSYFQINVHWSLDDYGVDDQFVNYVVKEFHITPNPIKSSEGIINILFQLKAPSQVEISLYNILGQKLSTIVDDKLSAGKHDLEFNLSPSADPKLASGIYLFKLSTKRSNYIKKALIF